MAKKKSTKSKVGLEMAPYNDKKWKAECDARTLADAKVIQQDKARMKEATKAAMRMADEKMKEATAMKNVASKGKK